MSGPGFRRSAAALTLALLVACTGMEGTGYSGGDGGGVVGGIEGTGYSGGGVTGIGSVFVNGIEYDTSKAEIVYDGVAAVEEALQVGMVLGVDGNVAADGVHGTARRVVFDPQLVGPVEAVDADARRFSVLGQPVEVNDDTVFVGVTPETLAEGNYCVVSGYRGATAITASYVSCGEADDEGEAGDTHVKVQGVVSGLAGSTFRIGSQLIDFSQAALHTSAGALVNGALVNVRGVEDEDVLQAWQLQVLPATPARSGQAARLEGLISGFGGPGAFLVSGQPVSVAAAQRSDSSDASLADGVHITVIGTVDGAGRLQAARYALRPESDARYTGVVDSVDAARGELAVFGLPASVSVEETQLADESSAAVRKFGLDDLAAGDHVELRVYRDAQGLSRATRVARRDAEARDSPTAITTFSTMRAASVPGPVSTDAETVRVRGAVEQFDSMQGTLDIAGVHVSTSSATTEFTDRDGNAVNSMEFFAKLVAGDRLEAEGGYNSGGVAADRVKYAP